MRFVPYLVANGNGGEAVAFYQQAFGAELVSLRLFGDMPDHEVSDEMKGRVMHAHLKIGEAELMLSDGSPKQEYVVGNNVSIAVTVNDPAEAKRVFEALADGGDVIMPLNETFWSPAYGQVTDKYGVEWQINTAAESNG